MAWIELVTPNTDSAEIRTESIPDISSCSIAVNVGQIPEGIRQRGIIQIMYLDRASGNLYENNPDDFEVMRGIKWDYPRTSPQGDNERIQIFRSGENDKTYIQYDEYGDRPLSTVLFINNLNNEIERVVVKSAPILGGYTTYREYSYDPKLFMNGNSTINITEYGSLEDLFSDDPQVTPIAGPQPIDPEQYRHFMFFFQNEILEYARIFN